MLNCLLSWVRDGVSPRGSGRPARDGEGSRSLTLAPARADITSSQPLQKVICSPRHFKTKFQMIKLCIQTAEKER